MVAKRPGRSTAAAAAPRRGPGLDADFRQITQADIIELPIESVRPSPENDELYHPPSPSDPTILALAKSIRSRGVQEPLVVTQDKWILSGHRRHYAAKLAGLRTVPCRIVPFRRDEDVKKFVRELPEYNQQRVKTFDEVVREEIVP